MKESNVRQSEEESEFSIWRLLVKKGFHPSNLSFSQSSSSWLNTTEEENDERKARTV